MALTANQVLYFPIPGLTNQAPALGRISLVAADANIAEFTGGGFGSAGFPFTATLKDAQTVPPLAFLATLVGLDFTPGARGVLSLPGGGAITCTLLSAFRFTVLAAALNPFTGVAPGADTVLEVGYVEVSQVEDAEGSQIALGGERFTIVMAEGPVGGPFVPNANWAPLGGGFAVAPNGGL